ncbi:endonuclease/exonuclease/phosphatase family protein [Opitutus sp. ER46]|uniref:endonuclease/exonuclease/phosphatase family protein n=1 Tax=Opitutus sp. ER46 TaxID=2161864 RepID=UPI001304C230|nr:endonuclease/exonuclease/phosphatase family protein [Opitutus sp. ER46]
MAGPRTLVLALVFAVLAVEPGLRAESLRIATYNVENYGPANRMTAAGFRPDYPKPEAEKTALRQVIRALRADVLVLQEMGSAAHLEELRRDLRAEGCDYPHAYLARAADTERQVAVLSRRPFTSAETITDLSFPYFGGRETVKRGLLCVTIRTEAGDLTVFGVHLKSRYTDREDDPLSTLRRTAEATAIRDMILKRFPNPAAARFLVLGDCNDTKASKPIARLRQRGETTISVLLPAADSRGETWTHCWQREDTYSRVDHILVAPALLPAVVEGTGRIHDGPGVREASDHRPVVVQLHLTAPTAAVAR